MKVAGAHLTDKPDKPVVKPATPPVATPSPAPVKPVAKLPAPAPVAKPTPKPRQQAAKVLVADDDKKRRAAIRARIEERVSKDEKVQITEVSSAQEAAELLMRTKGGFEIVFLDHDFGTAEWTGLDVAKVLTLLPDKGKPKKVYVHSRNPMGGARVVALLEANGIPAQRVQI